MEEQEGIKYSEDLNPQIVDYQFEIISRGDDNTEETLIEEFQTDVDASMYDTLQNEDEDEDGAAAEATFDEIIDPVIRPVRRSSHNTKGVLPQRFRETTGMVKKLINRKRTQ